MPSISSVIERTSEDAFKTPPSYLTQAYLDQKRTHLIIPIAKENIVLKCEMQTESMPTRRYVVICENNALVKVFIKESSIINFFQSYPFTGNPYVDEFGRPINVESDNCFKRILQKLSIIQGPAQTSPRLIDETTSISRAICKFTRKDLKKRIEGNLVATTKLNPAEDDIVKYTKFLEEKIGSHKFIQCSYGTRDKIRFVYRNSQNNIVAHKVTVDAYGHICVLNFKNISSNGQIRNETVFHDTDNFLAWVQEQLSK